MTLPTYDIVVPANAELVTNPGARLGAHWLFHTSPSTPWTGPNGVDHARVIPVDKEPHWVHLAELRFPSEAEWPADSWGSAMLDWHITAGDVGWGVGYGSGVAPLHVMVKALSAGMVGTFPVGPFVHTQYDKTMERPLPDLPTGKWLSLAIEVVWGNLDDPSTPPGELHVWLGVEGDTAATKVVEAVGINTLQRAQAPDGSWHTEKWVNYFEGGPYIGRIDKLGTQLWRHQHVATRFGRTWAEALRDQPVLLSEIPSKHLTGTTAVGPYGGDSKAVLLPADQSRNAEDFILPAEFQPPPPPPPVDPCADLKANAATAIGLLTESLDVYFVGQLHYTIDRAKRTRAYKALVALGGSWQ